MLKIEKVSIRFGDNPEAVSDTSIELLQGHKMVVIGETGSGKSVLLLAILKMLPRSAVVSGEILFDGKDLLKCGSEEMTHIRGARISYIPQGSGNGMNPLYTVGHQLSESMMKHKKMKPKAALEKSAALLEQFGLADGRKLCRAYPFMLSGGMRQRALIAMGIAADAELVLADEPTKGLDRHRIEMVVDAFRNLDDRPILCVTHDLRFAKAIASKIVVMYASQQIECADSEAFFSRPLHPYAQAMLAALPENGLQANMGFAPPRRDEDAQKGCHFYDRCADKTERCRRAPPMVQYGDRKVRCWKYADEDE